MFSLNIFQLQPERQTNIFQKTKSHTTSDNVYLKGVHACLLYLSLWIWLFNSSWFLYVVWSSSLVSSSSSFSTDTAFSSTSNCPSCSNPLLFSASREERRSCDPVCSCCSRNSSSSTKQCTELKSACFCWFSNTCCSNTFFLKLIAKSIPSLCSWCCISMPCSFAVCRESCSCRSCSWLCWVLACSCACRVRTSANKLWRSALNSCSRDLHCCSSWKIIRMVNE